MKTRESGSFFQVLSTPRLCQWIPRPTQLFFTSPSNSKTQYLHSIFHSPISNCTASRVKVLDFASLSANWCTELKFKVAQGQTLGTNVGHGVVSAVMGAEFGPSLQYLMQSISLVQVGQPMGSFCFAISLGTVPLQQVFCTNKQIWAARTHQAAESQRSWGWWAPLEISLPALTHSSLFRAASCQAMNTPKDGHAATSLGNLCQCLTPLTGKTFLLIFKRNFLYFH